MDRDKPVAMAHGSLPGVYVNLLQGGGQVDFEVIRQSFNSMKQATPPEYHIGTCFPIFFNEMEFLFKELDRLQGERDKAIKVLRWYAAKQTYMLGVNVTLSLNFPNQEPIQADKGDKARTILKELGVSGE